MTDEELTRLVETLNPENRAAVAAAVRAVREEALGPARATIRNWQLGLRRIGEKAPAALAAMEETALDPLLRAKTPESAAGRVVLARAIAEAILALERRTFARLQDFYQDGREVPPPEEAAAAEEPAPEFRVCDEAYVLLRQLVKFRETDVQFTTNRDAFLNLPDELKDEEILHAREHMQFRPLVEDLEEEEA